MSRRFTYSDVLAHIKQITGGPPNRSLNNLELTTRLCHAMNLPATPTTCVHVAGTKGKGSTSYLTAELLRKRGLRVGLFTSPHLVDVRERFLIDGQIMDADEFAEEWGEFKHKMDTVMTEGTSQLDREAASRSNYFRFLFLLSLQIFAARKLDVAVYEVGIGGRIDSTNIITPKVCGITAMGLDHQDILGDTIELITKEKAGIMKKDIPCFALQQPDHPSAIDVMRDVAREKQVPFAVLDDSILSTRHWPQMKMGGAHMIENARLAVALSRTVVGEPVHSPLSESEVDVLQRAQYPGRSQILRIREDLTVFLDGAHTAESMAAASRWFAAETASERDSHVTGLLMYTSRKPEDILNAFRGDTVKVDKAVFTTPKDTKSSPEGDAEAATHLLDQWKSLGCGHNAPAVLHPEHFDKLDDVVAAIREGLPAEQAKKPINLFVTGSLYMVGNALEMVMKESEAASQ